MKRTLKMAALAALAFGAQAAWSEDQASGQITVAQATASEARQMAVGEAQPARKPSMLEQLGLAGVGPFPSQGGPIDE